MNTTVPNAMRYEVAKAETDVRFLTVALFCGVGLIASLFCVLSFGLDVGSGFF
jgi:hypothetical protein